VGFRVCPATPLRGESSMVRAVRGEGLEGGGEQAWGVVEKEGGGGRESGVGGK